MPRLHVGKNYPVAFWRDWSTGQSRTDRYHARVYWFKLNNLFGALENAFETDHLRIHEDDPVHLWPPRWRSDPTLCNGRTITCTMELTAAGDDGRMVHKWELFDSAAGSIARGTGSAGFSNGYFTLVGLCDAHYQPHPAILSYLASNPTYEFRGVEWAAL